MRRTSGSKISASQRIPSVLVGVFQQQKRQQDRASVFGRKVVDHFHDQTSPVFLVGKVVDHFPDQTAPVFLVGVLVGKVFAYYTVLTYRTMHPPFNSI